MSDPTPTPVIVNANPAQENVESLVRQILLVAAGVASALGYSGVAGKFGALLGMAGPIAGLIVIVIGQLKTFKLAHAALPTTPVETKPGWLAAPK
jgi:hypothetical protein